MRLTRLDATQATKDEEITPIEDFKGPEGLSQQVEVTCLSTDKDSRTAHDTAGRSTLRAKVFATACCAFAAIGSFLFGYDTGIIASSISQQDFIAHFGGLQLSDNKAGAIVSSFTAGAIIGTLLVTLISDRYGRRSAIAIGAAVACLGGALQGGASVLASVIFGRVLAGTGIGLLSSTIPNYCSEIAPPSIRGALGGMQQWMLGLGIVTAQWVGYGGSLVGGSFSWRFPLALQIVPATLLMFGVYLLPESPRNLAERGRICEARAVLEKLRLRDRIANNELIDVELKHIEAAIRIERERTSTVTWLALFRRRSLRRRVLLACGIQLFSQTSGTNLLNYYAPRIYKALGYSTTRSLFIVGLYGALAQCFNTICIVLVDKVGRRKLLIPSMIGMGAALFVEATLAKYFDAKTTQNFDALRARIAMNFVFALFFTSLGVISWIYPSEIFPTSIRSKGTALSTLTNWTVNLILAQCSPIALSHMRRNFFYIFTAFNWTAALLVYLYYPETLGRTLEECTGLFDENVQEDFQTAENSKESCKC